MLEKKLYLMRGIPGSGKSTSAKKIVDENKLNYIESVFSTDNFWIPSCFKLKNIDFSNLEDKDLINLCLSFNSIVENSSINKQFHINFGNGNYIDCLNIILKNIEEIQKIEYIKNFNLDKLHVAHKKNKALFEDAVSKNINIIIIDNTNVTIKEGSFYVKYAHENNYEIIIKEPESPHWLKNRHLLKSKINNKEWQEFADLLFNKNTHGVPKHVILNMMNNWIFDPKVKDYLNS